MCAIIADVVYSLYRIGRARLSPPPQRMHGGALKFVPGSLAGERGRPCGWVAGGRSAVWESVAEFWPTGKRASTGGGAEGRADGRMCGCGRRRAGGRAIGSVRAAGISEWAVGYKRHWQLIGQLVVLMPICR